MPANDVTVRPVQTADRADWDRLYRGYAAFYKVEQSDEMRARVWSWLFDEGAESEGLVAQSGDGPVVGLAHFRPFARPLMAATGCFLDDLFVDPAARGSGVADALILAVRDTAKQRGWSMLRWITADDNYRGRAVYDRLATRTQWITYDLKI